MSNTYTPLFGVYDSGTGALQGLCPVNGTITSVSGSPVSITGTPLVGNALTVALATGWTASGYQWTRDGANISGATLSAYTLVSADSGHTVGVNVSGLAYAPTGLAVTGSVTKQLRALSPANIVNAVTLQASSGTQLHQISRQPLWIGSGDADSLVISFNGWYVNGSGGAVTVMPNDYVVVSARVEAPGATSLGQTVAVTFSGSRTKTITAGTTDNQSDVLTPAMFGLSKFTYGDRYFLRLEISVTTAALKFPTNTTISYLSGAGIGLNFDPAVYNGSTVDSPGFGAVGTGSAGGWTQQQQPYMPIVLGTFVTGDPATYFGTGDSLVQGQNDSSQKGHIAGGFVRSLWATDLVSNPNGGITLAASGATAPNVWSNTAASTLAAPLMKYCKVLYEEFGTNEYLTSPGTVAATTIAHSKIVWDLWTGQGNSASMIYKPLFTPRILAPAKLALSTLTSSGTTVTAGYGTTAAAPIVGNAVIVTDCVPTAYNGTVTVTAVDTSAKTFTYTAGSAPGTATTVGNWNDQYATVANQPPINAAWVSGGNARLANEAIVAQVGSGIGGFIPLNSVRGSTNRTTDAFYQWVANGTANYVIDQSVNATGTHPNAVGYALEGSDIRTALAGL